MSSSSSLYICITIYTHFVCIESPGDILFYAKFPFAHHVLLVCNASLIAYSPLCLRATKRRISPKFTGAKADNISHTFVGDS